MLELSYRISIIEKSNLDDAIILDRNYKQLIRETADPIEVELFVTLSNVVLLRLQTLQKEYTTN